MTRRLAAVALASLIGGLSLAATPTYAAHDVQACVTIPTRNGPPLVDECIWDYVATR